MARRLILSVSSGAENCASKRDDVVHMELTSTRVGLLESMPEPETR